MRFCKKIGLFICCVLLLFSGIELTLAFTALPAVRYDGKEKQLAILNTQGTDLFREFKALVPGDTVTQSILLQFENISRKTDLYMRAETPDNSELPENIRLKVYVADRLISDSDLNSQDALKEKVLLYEFSQSEEVEIKAVLEVPAEIGNEISDRRKELRWIFYVQEEDNREEDPKSDDTAGFDTIIEAAAPETGDPNRLVGYLFIHMCSMIGVFLILFRKRTQK